MVFIKYLKNVPDVKNFRELEEWFRNNAYPLLKNSREIFAEYLKKTGILSLRTSTDHMLSWTRAKV
ncbi:hypothetical protein A3D76_00790 [Candidatus Roizmanbacteria bacterium RIFCSPHIGHO2_02_FULL_37_9b]|nr:MAG: hypothetical protein A3D76_00790 [Candidatus Roizmanbacteria bacterium RIFCSPHIGHO2_02_FULL_37_9b]